MSARPDETIFSRAKVFCFLDEAGRGQVLEVAHQEEHPGGAVIVAEGSPGDGFYVLLEGRVRVLVDDLGASREMAVLEAGNFFGEMSTLTGAPRLASVVAEGPVKVLRFPAEAINDLLARYPRLKEALAKVSVRRSEQNLEKMLADDFSLELSDPPE